MSEEEPFITGWLADLAIGIFVVVVALSALAMVDSSFRRLAMWACGVGLLICWAIYQEVKKHGVHPRLDSRSDLGGSPSGGVPDRVDALDRAVDVRDLFPAGANRHMVRSLREVGTPDNAMECVLGLVARGFCVSRLERGRIEMIRTPDVAGSSLELMSLTVTW